MIARWLSGILVVLILSAAAPAQEKEEKPDDKPLDAVAEVAAASVAPEETKFERLWTSDAGVRLFQGLAISADGKRVAALDIDGTPAFYDGGSGEVVSRLKEKPEALVTRIALSSDGSRAAIGLHNGEALVVDTSSGEVAHRHTLGKDEIVGVHVSSDRKFVSAVDCRGVFHRFGIAGGAVESHTFDFVAPGSNIVANSYVRSAFTPGGRIFLFYMNPNQPQLFYFLLAPPNDPRSPPTQRMSTSFDHPPVALAQSARLVLTYTTMGELFVSNQPALNPGTSTGTYWKASSQLTLDTVWTKHAAISSDEKWIFGVGRGQVEIRPTDCLMLPSIHNADFDYASQVAIAPDAFRLAVVDQDGRVAVLQLSQRSDLPAWRFRRTIGALRRAKRFKELDELAELVAFDPEPFPFRPTLTKYEAFNEHVLNSSNPPQLDQPFPEFIAEWLKARPDSQMARIHEAKRLIVEGWEVRGSGFANTVSEDQWKVFYAKIAEAHEVIQPVVDLAKPFPAAFSPLGTIARAESWDTKDALEQFSRLLKISPGYLTPHDEMIQKLLPRWGGGPESSARYAELVAEKIGGDEGEAAYAELVYYLCNYEPKEVLAEMGIDFPRALRGCEKLKEMSHRRNYGLCMELRLAALSDDQERINKVVEIIRREKIPFVSTSPLLEPYSDYVYRTNLGRKE